MVFSLCSSAGLHGVFVRLFLADCVEDIGSAYAPLPSPSPPGSENAADEEIEGGAKGLRSETFRLRELGGRFGGRSAP